LVWEGDQVLVDTHGRRIEYLRISVTDRCNLRCSYCMPADGIELKQCSDMLSYEQICQIAEEAARLGINKIRLTGGEPLVRKGVEDLVRMLAEIDGIEEIAMTTNALLITPQRAHELRGAGLDRLNISLDTLDPLRYAELTRGGKLADALAGVDAAIAAGFERTKINMVVFDSTTLEEISAMREFCLARGFELQRIRHFSLTGDAVWTEQEVECERPMPCDMCNRLRLTSDGYLKPCLMSDSEIEVDFNDLESCLRRAVEAKPNAGTSCNGRSMRQIGG
jgi:cyclic pyranopterin phosphate synthase